MDILELKAKYEKDLGDITQNFLDGVNDLGIEKITFEPHIEHYSLTGAGVMRHCLRGCRVEVTLG